MDQIANYYLDLCSMYYYGIILIYITHTISVPMSFASMKLTSHHPHSQPERERRLSRKPSATLHTCPRPFAGIEILLKGGVAFDSSNDLLDTISRCTTAERCRRITLGVSRSLGLYRTSWDAITPDSIGLPVPQWWHAWSARPLETARLISCDTSASSIGTLLSLGPVSGNEMMDLLDWLVKRQPWIEKSLGTPST